MTAREVSDLDHALKSLASGQAVVPRAAIILGSGISALNSLNEEKSFSFLEIFGIAPGVAGHGGRVRIGWLDKRDPGPILLLEGRFHLYEGHDWSTVTMPMRLLVTWGVPLVLITNAAGGLNREFAVGDLMVTTAYRDLLNPRWQVEGLVPALKGPAKNAANKVTERLLALGRTKDDVLGQVIAGTFAGLLGPNYETLAEIEMLTRLGCDAVAMSAIPELETVAGTQTQAAALSVITNVWWNKEGLAGHSQVLEVTGRASVSLDRLFRRLLTLEH